MQDRVNVDGDEDAVQAFFFFKVLIPSLAKKTPPKKKANKSKSA